MRRTCLLLGLAITLISPPLLGQDLGMPSAVEGLRWVDAESGRIGVVARPARRLRDDTGGGRLSNLARLGELAFRQPVVLGGEARLAGLSCATCHPNGGANVEFEIPGLSDRAGNVDVTHRAFGDFLADRRANPLNIPSLRGVAATAPYGRAGRIASLRAFTRRVIVLEFGGEEPAPWLLDALVAYQNQLAFPKPSPAQGDETLVARGRALFQRPFAGDSGLGCASCHPSSAAFQDGRNHDVGTGGYFNTPTLLGLAETPPYFHDGRSADLAATVRHFDARFDLRLEADERAALVAYLARVGSVSPREERITLEGEVASLLGFFPLLEWAAKRDFSAIGSFVATALRREAGLIHARLPHERGRRARDLLAAWSRDLRAMRDRFGARDFAAARRAYTALRRRMREEIPLVTGAGAGSLYEIGEIDVMRRRPQR